MLWKVNTCIYIVSLQGAIVSNDSYCDLTISLPMYLLSNLQQWLQNSKAIPSQTQ